MPSNQRQTTEQEKQTEKQVTTIKSLDLSNEKGELKQIDGIFPKKWMNDLIDDLNE